MVHLSAYSTRFFKADQRTSDINADYRRYSSFREGEPRAFFGDLLYLDDVYLAPGRKNLLQQSPELYQLIIPVSGALVYDDEVLREEALYPEEYLLISNKGEALLRNPLLDKEVNYLHVGIRKPDGSGPMRQKHHLELDVYDQWISLEFDKSAHDYYACIGLFKGRSKASYTLKHPGHGILVYVVNGAFEVEDRLMEHRDALALWDTETIELEALSSFAILMVLEVPLPEEKHP